MSLIHTLPDTATSRELEGQVVLITGGGSGLGREVAVESARAGARVLVVDLNVEGCKETCRLALASASRGGACKTPPTPCNVLDPASLRAAIAFSRSAEGYGCTPGAVVANAGVNGAPEGDGMIDDPEIGPYPAPIGTSALDVNLKGVIGTVHAVRSAWAEDDGKVGSDAADKKRKIVLIASMGGLDGIPLATWYAAAKHGVMGYWAALCAEMRRQAGAGAGEVAFRCYAICPFFSLTPMIEKPIRLLLAGAPKVLPITVGQTILSVLAQPSTAVASASGPSASTDKGAADCAGWAVLLPDDKEAIVVRDREWNALGPEMYAAIDDKILQRGSSLTDPKWKTLRNKEALEALGLTTVTFSVLVAALVLTLGTAVYISHKTPTWLALAIGMGLGGVHRLGRS